MANNSDYKKPRTNLFEQLPSTLQSDINKTIFENTFNRFLTKEEVTKIAGYVGNGEVNAIVNRQIKEPTVHRQGFQLQPILSKKIGSTEHFMSFDDMLNELRNIGIDVEKMGEWGAVEQFNWIPPIDLDKLINYQDYYWVDDNIQSSPQYITIKKPCTTITAFWNFYSSLIDEFGISQQIVGISAVAEEQEKFNIAKIDQPTNRIYISDNIVDKLSINEYFLIRNSVGNDNTYQVVEVYYDRVLEQTVIVTNNLISSQLDTGYIELQKYNGVIVNGDLTNLFDIGFVIFIKNSGNPEINNSFFEVVASTYNSNTNQTTVKINHVFSNTFVDGVISHEEKLKLIVRDKKCSCFGVDGFDTSLFDDNPANPIWDGLFDSVLTDITHSGSPMGNPVVGTLWFDEEADILYQYDVNQWKLIYNNFSLLVTDTQGLAVWDQTSNCKTLTVTPSAQQWIEQNNWVHKTDVSNFSQAKQAQHPIIEFFTYLELNEWTENIHSWKYRVGSTKEWENSNHSPTYIELVPLAEWVNINGNIKLDPKYGNLTDIFQDGFKFIIGTQPVLYHTKKSTYVVTDNEQYTLIELYNATDLTLTGGNTIEHIRPVKTSNGDTWVGYDEHWVYNGISKVVPVNHQIENPYILQYGSIIDESATKGYQYSISQYSQTYIIVDSASITTFDVNVPYAVSTNTTNVRVYVNDIRQYDFTVNNLEIVLGSTVSLQDNDVVRIEFGPAALIDIGWNNISVRTYVDDGDFAVNGTKTVDLFKYNKQEQIKRDVNQYPLFDMYNTDGRTAHLATKIFGYKEDSEYPFNPQLGSRIVYDELDREYTFEQYLLTNNNELLAYKDYSLNQTTFWVDTKNNKIYKQQGLYWSDYFVESEQVIKPEFNEIAPIPSSPEHNITGYLFFDTLTNQLKQRNDNSSCVAGWDVIDDVIIQPDDPLVQTIWKHGITHNRYVPQKVDWKKRTLTQYNLDKTNFIENEILKRPDLTEADARREGERLWADKEKNHLSDNGQWIGEWEIPDPLYYNNQHENRKEIKLSQILTHFATIIDAQQKIPGFRGTFSQMFHLLDPLMIDYGVGGKIKEFNNSVDVFYSTLFINNVNIPTLLQFAQDQYLRLQNDIREYFRNRLTEFLTMTTDVVLSDFKQYIINQLIQNHEQNDLNNLLFNDSTTFTDNLSGFDVGIRNWIATLPYLGLIYKQRPTIIKDESHNINHIIHHDGHVDAFNFSDTVLDSIIRYAITLPDNRVDDTIGRISTTLPPETTMEFATLFNTDIVNRHGVLWYNFNTKQLYKLNVVSSGAVEPSQILPDGSLWLDTNTNNGTLRIKNTNVNSGIVSWNIVNGLSLGDGKLYTDSISAWQEIKINDILNECIVAIEQKLYDNAETIKTLRYETNIDTVTRQQYLEKEFLKYVREQQISSPYVNTQYIQNDPFTWNYTYCSIGEKFEIIESNTTNNYFVVKGNVVNIFDPCSTIGSCPATTTFYIKNSTNNNGTWHTLTSDVNTSPVAVYDTTTDTTKIYVAGQISTSDTGIIYRGVLASTHNDGSEYGGYWKGLYQRIYNTPYPHLEPWKLQGYVDKPEWWDEEYLDTTGERRWKHKHGFELVEVRPLSDIFVIDGDYSDIFVPGFQFTIDNSPGAHNGNYDVVSVNVNINNQTEIKVSQNLVTTLTDGRITVSVGMWENIRKGIIPAGRTYPNGVNSITGDPNVDYALCLPKVDIPKYNYFSVNITNDIIDDGVKQYKPDDVFPPYWNFSAVFGNSTSPMDNCVRSVYTNYSNEIFGIGADYKFGDLGPIEFEWTESLNYLYSEQITNFKTDPIRYVNKTFGFNIEYLNHLQIDKDTKQTISHNRLTFHGELNSTNSIVKYNGLNQWYVNFNRYTGYDTRYSDFGKLFTEWTAPLTYQFSAFIDTDSFQLSHRYIDINDFDYSITTKKSAGVESYWIESFNVDVLQFPPSNSRLRSEYLWKFNVNTQSPVGEPIQVYDVKNYQFSIKNGICQLFTYDIVNVDISNDSVAVAGDQTKIFTAGLTATIKDTTLNDGEYVIVDAVFDAANFQTYVILDTELYNTNGGYITCKRRSLPWNTGDLVTITSSGALPTPLLEQTQYFIIKLDDDAFQLAYNLNDALAGVPMSLTIQNENTYVGEVVGTFTALNGKHTVVEWNHYAIDKDNVLELVPPFVVYGVPELINIIDGYNQWCEDQGWVFNNGIQIKDPDTGRPVSWQLEVERLIDYIYGMRTELIVDNRDTYNVSVDTITSIWSFDQYRPQYITGDPVYVQSTGNVPTPLTSHVQYYIIRDSLTTFRIARTKKDAEAGISISISDVGNGQLSLISPKQRNFDKKTLKINPFRELITFKPTRGIVSDVIKGPNRDITTSQLLFDQYKRPLSPNNIQLYREDKLTNIVVTPNDNDVEPTEIFQDPYNLLHLAGGHLYIDTYEHIIQFNDYTPSNQLIYDSFIGLNTNKIEMLFNRQITYTHRPNMGGYYLETFFDQGANFKRNIESNIEDIRYLYDTFVVHETNQSVKYARKGIGYDGTKDYLDKLNINAKSQFLFWKGQIQNKGSMNVVNAFINSRRFIDAEIDEFWALKIADFGHVDKITNSELFLDSTDVRNNVVKLQFSTANLLPNFKYVDVNDSNIWNTFIDQEINIDLKGIPTNKLNVTVNTPIIIHGFKSDTIRISWSRPNEIFHLSGNTITTNSLFSYNKNDVTVYKNGQKLVNGVDYVEVDNGIQSNTITLTNNVTTADTILIKFNIFLPTDYYNVVNSDIVELTVDGNMILNNEDIIVWGFRINNNIHPLKIYDTKAKVSTHKVVLWDPARNHHNVYASKDIDFIQTSDPANYGDVIPNNFIPWGHEQVGSIWFDTSLIQYVPYYDQFIFPNINDQIFNWGKLGEWIPKDENGNSMIPILQWVESDVPPNEWNDIAAKEEIDNSISEYHRKSGKAVTKTYYRNRKKSGTFSCVPATSGKIEIVLDPLIYGNTELSNNTGLFEGWTQQIRINADDTNNTQTIVTPYFPLTVTLTATLNGVPIPIVAVNNTQVDVTTNGVVEDDVIVIVAEPQIYTAVITVNGIDRYVTVKGDEAQTFEQLISIIENDMLGDATLLLNNNIINIQNNSSGGVSTMAITEPNVQIPNSEPLFSSLINFDNILTTNGQDQQIVLSDTNGLANGDQLLFTSDQELPEPLKVGVPYTISNVNNNNIELIDVEIISASNPIAQNMFVTTEFDQDWNEELTILKRYNAIEHNISNNSIMIDVSVDFNIGDTISVYKNGIFEYETVLTSQLISINGTKHDIIYVVKFAHTLTDDDKNFDPTKEDLGDVLTQYKEEYQYTKSYRYDQFGTKQSLYYFWVSDKRTRSKDTQLMSIYDMRVQLTKLPIPYCFFLNKQDSVDYDKLVIRGIQSFINENRRYVLRFPYNTELENSSQINQKHSHHEQWVLFREKQLFHITELLWNKVVESIAGFKHSNNTIDYNHPIPSLEREMYDLQFNDDTRYGLKSDQTFIDKDVGLDIILQDLTDPNIDFYPMDIKTFLDRYKFDTPENIVDGLNALYAQFAHEHVNRIFFKLLHHSFSVKKHYTDVLMKTSMIALHGIKPFPTPTVFDD